MNSSERENYQWIVQCKLVCDCRPIKPEPFRFRIILGGEILEYMGDAASPEESLSESELLFNSTVLDAHRGDRVSIMLSEPFFLETPTFRADFTRIHSKYFPLEIRSLYHIDEYITK